MCPSGATCLPADCCFSVPALLKSNSACWSTNGGHHCHLIECNLLSPWHSWKIKQQSLTLYKKLKHNIFVMDEILKCVLHFCTACCPFTFNWLAMAVSHKFTLVFIYRVFCILVDAFIYNMLSTCLKIL